MILCENRPPIARSGLNLYFYSQLKRQIVIIPFISKLFHKIEFINVFEALRYLSDKQDKHYLKAHEKITNSDCRAGFVQQAINMTQDKLNFKEKKNIQQKLHLLFCSLYERVVCKKSSTLLWNMKVPKKIGTPVVQALMTF